MANAKHTIAKWKVELLDLNNNKFRLTFDIFEGDQPLVIGDNKLKHFNRTILSYKPFVVTKSPHMEKSVEFASYPNPGEDPRRCFIDPFDVRKKANMTGKATHEKATIKAACLIVRKIYTYCHNTANDMRASTDKFDPLNKYRRVFGGNYEFRKRISRVH